MKNIIISGLSFLILLGFSKSGMAQPPEHDVIAYCIFDSSLTDLTGNFSTFKTKGISYAQSRKGKSKQSLFLDKKSVLIYKDNADSLTFNSNKNLSFTFWIKAGIVVQDSNQYLLSKNYSNVKKPGYALRINKAGELECVFRYSSKKKDEDIYNSGVKITDDKWHFIQLGIENGRSFSLHIDENKAKFEDTVRKINIDDDSLFYIGTNAQLNEHFTGFIDDFRAYGVLLSDLEKMHLFREGVLINYILIPLNDRLSANNSCTFMVGLDPTGEEVIFNTGKYEKMKGYSIRVINSKGEILTTFPVEKSNYSFGIRNWGGHGRYFMQVLDENNHIENIFKLNLYF